MTWKKYKPLEVSVHQYKATYLFLNDDFATIIWAFHGLLLTLFNMILWTCMEIQTSRLVIIFFQQYRYFRVFVRSLLLKLDETNNSRTSFLYKLDFDWFLTIEMTRKTPATRFITSLSGRYAQLVWTEVFLFNFDLQSELSRIMRSKADGYGDWRLSVRGNNIFEH